METLNKKHVADLIRIASRTSSYEEIDFLSKNPSMNVRRAIARNTNTPKEILQKLVNDPVLNVSYMANKNPNNMVKKEFDELSACVICEKDEVNLNCVGCDETKEHSF